MSGKNLRASVIIGGSMSSSFRSAMSSTKSGLKAIGDEIVRVERRQRLASEQIQVFGRMGKNIDGMRQRYASLTQTVDKLRTAQNRLALANERVESNRAKRAEIGGKLRGASTTFGVVAAATLFPIRQAVQFETAMLGVAKQVNGARDAGGKLTPIYFAMARQIQRLGHEIPMATNEIADMVTAGARMGIARDQLIGFVRDSAMMSTAFDMPAAELSESMGKIAGIFKIPVPAIGELGDAINHLDDNAMSKGSDIIRVMQGDLAGAANTMGLSAKNAAALASTFLTLGESAERADTAAAGMLRQLQIAKMNPKRFQIGVQMLGMTADRLQKGMVDDPQAMILDVLTRIKKLPVEQQMEAVTRLFGKDWGGAIAKLANGVGEYRRQLELANGAAAKGGMSREFQARMQTSLAKWQITKNRMSEVSVAIGSALLPAVDSLFKTVGPVVEKFAQWAQENPKLVKGIVGGALALTGLRVAALGVRFAFHSALSPILSTWSLIARFRAASAAGNLGIIGKAVQGLGRGFMWLGRTILMNPIFLVGAAVAGLAYEIYKHWDGVKAFFGRLWVDLKSIFGGGLKVLTGLFTGNFGMMIDGVKQIFNGFKSFADDLFKGIADGFTTIVDDALEAMGLLDKKKREQEVGKAQAAKETAARHDLFKTVTTAVLSPAEFTRRVFQARHEATGKAAALPTRAQGRTPTTLRAAAASARGRSSSAGADANGSGQNVTLQGDNVNIHVTQQPGESSEELADRIGEVLARRKGARMRGAAFDYG